MNNTFLAYMAGFIDGEGCIRIGVSKSLGHSPCHRLELIVANTDVKPLLKMQEVYGGHVRGRRKDSLMYWTVYNDVAIQVIKDIRPYLITKAPQADVALEFHSTKTKYVPSPGHKLPLDELKLRDFFLVKIKELKRVPARNDYQGASCLNKMVV
jgi:hypothetical protein